MYRGSLLHNISNFTSITLVIPLLLTNLKCLQDKSQRNVFLSLIKKSHLINQMWLQSTFFHIEYVYIMWPFKLRILKFKCIKEVF